MKITIEPERGETSLLFRQFIEPMLPAALHSPDNVVLATDGFRLRWNKGPLHLDATLILKAESG